MILKTLTIHNFMPYFGVTKIAFSHEERRNVTIINGANMRGKTSLLNALRWVFYGAAINRSKVPYEDFVLINRLATDNNDWEMSVHVEFDSNGDRYELIRKIKQRFVQIVPRSSSDLELTVMLSKNGNVFSADQVEMEISRIVPEQTSRFFLFDGELLAEYEVLVGEESGQAKDIKKAIEGVLGVPALVFGRDCSAGLLRTARNRMSNEAGLVTNLHMSRTSYEKLSVDLDSSERRLTEFNKQLDSNTQELRELSARVDAAESTYQAKVRRDAIKAQIDELQVELYTDLSKRTDYVKEAWREVLRPKLSIIQSELNTKTSQQLSTLRQRSSIESKISELKKSKERQSCAVCNHSLGEEQLREIGKELGLHESELDSLKVDFDAIAEFSSQKTTVDRLLKPTNATLLRSMDRDLSKKSVSLSRLEGELSDLDKEVASYDVAEIQRDRMLRDGMLKLTGTIKANISAEEAKRDKLENDLKILSATIKARLNDQNQHENSVVTVNKLESLEKIYAVSISKLRDKLRRKVEQESCDAFVQLTTQKNYSGVKINANYGLTIFDENQLEIPIRSAGAEQIVALALICGLAHSASTSMPIVMDTPFGRLDNGHRKNVLRYLPTACNQLILLVHDGELNLNMVQEAIPDRLGNIYNIKNVSHVHSTIEQN
jgi:DNA sulfur modification protein DndD